MVVKQIKYLGMRISDTANIFKDHIKEKVQKAGKYKFWVNYILQGKIYKANIGKILWKGAILPTILHGMEICYLNRSQLHSIQNTVLKNILNMPSRTPNAYIQAEIGTSSLQFRDIKMKILMLKHIIERTIKLSRLVALEWNKKHKWIEVCKKYLNYMQLSTGDLEKYGKQAIINLINKKEEKEWREEMASKSGLKYYRITKLHIKQDTWWKNQQQDRIIRLFQCGALLTRHKTGNTPLDKQCEECEVIETIEHLVKYCKKYECIRKDWDISETTTMLDILDVKQQSRWGFLEKLYILRFLAIS